MRSSSVFALSAAVAAASAQGIQPAPSSTVVAAPGSLPLGANCATTEQCANGAQCWGSTAWTIKACGKFNAACTSDDQCATNTCVRGLCNGFIPSSSSSSAVAAPSTSMASSSTISPMNATSSTIPAAVSTGLSSVVSASTNGTLPATQTSNGTLPANQTRTATPSLHTGAASRVGYAEGLFAVGLAAFAFML